MNKNTLPALALMLASMAGADEETELDRPTFYASQVETVAAEVTAINLETREVTLLSEDGEILNIVAPEEARNLGQVRVGDILYAEYEETLSIEVVANDGYGPGAAQVEGLQRAAEGKLPGMAAVETTVITAKVDEINLEANSFKLRGPEGNVTEYTAHNPENLKRAKVGDLVVITVTEAVAISMERAKE